MSGLPLRKGLHGRRAAPHLSLRDPAQPARFPAVDDVPTEPKLSERQERILSALCRDYIVSGREVSSSGLQRTHGFRWSSATIRQELAALESMGFLERPHRSAGRLPTRSGMRRYVATLPTPLQPRPDLARVVDRSLRDPGRHLERDLRAASRVLSEVAGCVAVTFLGQQRTGRIADVDIVPLHEARALVVMSFEDRSTVMHPVTLDRLAAGSDDFDLEMTALLQRLRALCRGRTLCAARRELLDLQEEHEAHFDGVLAEALRVGLTLCAGASLEPLVLQVAGQPSLARQAPAIEGLSEVLELLEDVHRLADVLCQLLPDLRVSVQVGLDALPDVPQGLTVVGCRLPHPDALGGSRTGAVALLGSPRMDYAAVIPLVEYAARTLAPHTRAESASSA